MKRVSVVVAVLLVLGAWMVAVAANPPKDCSNQDIQTLQGIALGDSVRTRNTIITGIDISTSTYGFWSQDAGGGAWSGLLDYTNTAFPTGLARGDIVNVKGIYAEYSGCSENNSYVPWYWEKVGHTTVPNPVLLSCRDVGQAISDSSRAEKWEGVLVKIDTVVVVKHDPAYPATSYFVVEAHVHPPATSADTVYIRNNKLISPGPGVPDNGDTLVSITGIHHQENSRYHICPRDGDDIVYLGATPAPNLAIAFATSNTSIDAVFDAKLDETTAENKDNYGLGTGTHITLATMQSDSLTVRLTTDPQTPGELETLTACCIKGLSGTVMPASQDYSFRAGLSPISYIQTPKSASNDSSQYATQEVTVAGIVTGNNAAYGTQFYVENTPGGPWSGVQIFGGIPTSVAEGDSVIVAGYVNEYYFKTEVTSVDYLNIVSSGNTIPGPNLVDPSVIRTGATTAESYEGVFVRCNPVYVADTTGWQGFGEWHVADMTPDTVMVGHTGSYTYIPKIGKWMNICGPIDYVYDNFRIEPRRNADIDTVNVTGVDNTPAKPQVFALEQNTPNPFNPVTTIYYSIPERANVRLYVYDISGRLVKTLVDGVSMVEGRHKATWDGSNNAGRAVSSGVYFCSLQAADKSAQMKMVILK